MRRRLSFVALLALLAGPVVAQAQAPAAPTPAPDVRPPAMEVIDDTVEPQVTIRKQEGSTVEEYRVNGRLYKIKVTPDRGVPYYLVDQKGDGTFTAVDAPGTPSLSVPMWVIGTF